MKNERVDELIDRVASELVDNRLDPMFTTRVRARLVSRRQRVSTPMMLLAGIGAAIVAAFVVVRPFDTSTDSTFAPVSAEADTPVAPDAPAASASVPDSATADTPVAPSRTQSDPVTPSVSLAIAPLVEIPPLEDVAFDVGSLEVEALAIAALEEEDQKEPR